MKTQLVILLVMLAALFAAAPAASAQGCDGWYGGGWGYGMGYLYNSLDYNVPYFAAHPPVYYSYPVPRTYGYSPFAYPPGTITPEAPPKAAAVEYLNPFVPQQTGSAGNKTASTPRMYYNPFVKKSQFTSTLATALKAKP